MRARIMILCVVAIAACSRANPSLPFTAGSQPSQVITRPDTLHVVPLFDFPGGRGGENKIGNKGGVGGVVSDPKGALFGVASVGGDLSCGGTSGGSTGGGCGLLFELIPQPGKTLYKERVIHTFSGPDGSTPLASLVTDRSGALYGTTWLGGKYDAGVVYKLAPDAHGSTESVIHAFKGGMDGVQPLAPLAFDKNGDLFGTTSYGGGSGCIEYSQRLGCGTVFELKPSGSSYSETVLHHFSGGKDGAFPVAGVLIGKDGTIFGTTEEGGVNCGCGTVFALTPSKSGYDERVLHAFGASKQDGESPEAGLTADSSGDLFGTTAGSAGSSAYGTIFELKPSGSHYTETIVHAFTDKHIAYGQTPQTPLTPGADGFWYGTTTAGGKSNSSTCYGGCGVIYRLTPTRSFEVVYRFQGGFKGSGPSAPLYYAGHALYGEALGAFSSGKTFVFRLEL